jgi:hypothetical protein
MLYYMQKLFYQRHFIIVIYNYFYVIYNKFSVFGLFFLFFIISITLHLKGILVFSSNLKVVNFFKHGVRFILFL